MTITPNHEQSERAPLVCFFPGELQLGGVGRNTINMGDEMLRRGVRVDFFLSRNAGAYAAQVPTGVRIFEGKGSVRASIPSLVRYLRSERPDLLIAARPYINIASVIANRIAGRRAKVVLTERTSGVAEGREFGGFRRKAIGLASRIAYPLADHVVAVSGAVAEDLALRIGMDRSRIRVIYNPVVTDRILRLAEEEVPLQWPATPSVRSIVGVGRLSKQKDFPTLIRAFSEVRKRLDVRLTILGEGEDRHELEALVRDLGVESDVWMPGYAENPFAYVAQADAFVLSSAWEGLPTALIEALAVGTPAVSTDCPGGSREILADGRFGELVPVGNVPALARAIEATLARPPEPARLQERALHFSATRATDEYLSFLSKPAGA